MSEGRRVGESEGRERKRLKCQNKLMGNGLNLELEIKQFKQSNQFFVLPIISRHYKHDLPPPMVPISCIISLTAKLIELKIFYNGLPPSIIPRNEETFAQHPLRPIAIFKF